MNNTPQITRLRNNVDCVQIGDRTIIVVGTAHVSHESNTLVKEVLTEHQPDAVAIELCESRYNSLREEDRWRNMQLSTVIREGKAYILLTQLILAAFQRKIGKGLNIRPGQEMLTAAECAEEAGVPIILADRELKITFKRLWRRLTWRTLSKLAYTALSSLVNNPSISEEEIERLKNEAMLEDILAEFTKEFPDIKETLISERDRYMTTKILESPHKKIVAILGAGHSPGVTMYLQKPPPHEDLEAIPPRSLISRSFMWIIPALIVLLIVFGFIRGTGEEMVWSWLVITGGSCFIGAAIALGHPLTMLVSTLVAPFTTLNPFLRSGWIAALIEVSLRKPHVHDMETLLDDITNVRGWYRNRVARGLLVMMSVNLCGLIGSLFGLKVLATLL